MTRDLVNKAIEEASDNTTAWELHAASMAKLGPAVAATEVSVAYRDLITALIKYRRWLEEQ